MQRLQSTHTRLREASAAQVSALEEQLAVRDSTISQLEATVNSQKDYEELRRELRYQGHTFADTCLLILSPCISVIKMIEFSSSGPASSPEDTDGTTGVNDTLCTMVYTRDDPFPHLLGSSLQTAGSVAAGEEQM